MKKVFLLFLFIFPSIALSATNIPTSQLIYTWGYGDVINEILQAIKGIILETDYIFKAAMAIALLIFSIKKLGDDRVSPVLEIGKMFGLFAVVWYFFLTAPNDDKHRFMIHDEVTSKDYIVSQIPTGIGVTFALMSNFEKIMLDGMEKYFSTPQSANFSSAGLGFSLEAMMSLPKIKLSNINPTAQKNLDLFFRNCVAHGIRLHQNGRELYGKSDNFIDDLFDSIGRGSQLTLYYKTDKATGAETSDMFPCTEAGAKIKQDIMNSMDMAQTLHTALLGFEKDKALYEQKFQGAVQIFNTQATSARAYLQQSMLLFASQDAIINTAKSVGLDSAAVAANTAIADQNFFASMQTQGRLAQTYLPLAKAYLTAIIIGISWLIAILSVIFASYSYIRMFFVLCLWMTLWTPILCIINYLNDLNLMKVASVITEGRVALSVSDNMLIFRKVAESSNFINYMVMMTPLLAFAIAKGSEMGFVNLATGIAGSLTKAAGSGGSFSNQQGQSTESKMSAPKGDEVWAKSAGIESLQGALSVGSGRFSVTQTADGGINAADVNSGTSFSTDRDHITSAKIAGFNANSIKSMQTSASNEVSNAISDTLKTGQTSQSVANLAFDKSASHTINAQAQEIFRASSTMAFDKMAAAGDVRGQQIASALEAGGKLVVAGGTVSVTEQDGTTRTFQFSQREMEQWGKDFSDNVASTYSYSDSARASLNHAFSSFSGKEFAQVQSAIQKYSSLESLSNSVSTDSMPKALDNYIKSGDNPAATNAWNSGDKATAGAIAANDFQNMIHNNPQQLEKYFQVGSFGSPANQIGAGPNPNTNYYDRGAVVGTHGTNQGAVNASATGFADTYESNKNTLAGGHLAQTGQNTAYGSGSSGTIKNEVAGQVNNATNNFGKEAPKRTVDDAITAGEMAGKGAVGSFNNTVNALGTITHTAINNPSELLKAKFWTGARDENGNYVESNGGNNNSAPPAPSLPPKSK